MIRDIKTGNINDIEYRVIYSGRRTLGITILPDSSVIVRVPYLTSLKTINRIVQQKADWIIKHRETLRNKKRGNPNKKYVNGEIHLFRGNEFTLKIEKFRRSFVQFNGSTIDLALSRNEDSQSVKTLLYKGYKKEALIVFPEIFSKVLTKYDTQNFKPKGLVIRTMKRRWGSCSSKGLITLSTELIKLADIYIEYVILHELCHLKHHNHSARYYRLLSELFPEWRAMRRELRKHIQ